MNKNVYFIYTLFHIYILFSNLNSLGYDPIKMYNIDSRIPISWGQSCFFAQTWEGGDYSAPQRLGLYKNYNLVDVNWGLI